MQSRITSFLGSVCRWRWIAAVRASFLPFFFEGDFLLHIHVISHLVGSSTRRRSRADHVKAHARRHTTCCRHFGE